MEQIELVIRLQKKLYDEILSPRRMDEEDASACYDAIKNGTPLPKGHGQLIDAEALKEKFVDSDEALRWEYIWIVRKKIDDAPTIIEADKEGAEE